MLSLPTDLTLSKWHILDTSKLEEFADDNFTFDENGRKFSKRIENTVEKGEIARYEQLLLFPVLFFVKRLVLHTNKNQGMFEKGLRSYTYFTQNFNWSWHFLFTDLFILLFFCSCLKNKNTIIILVQKPV